MSDARVAVPQESGTTSATSRSSVSPTVRSTLRRTRRALPAHCVGWLFLTAAGVGIPWVLSLYQLQFAVQGVIMGILALSIGWLLRQTGQLSFGHAAFYGIAGYGAAYAATTWDIPLGLVLLVGIGAGTLSSLVVALVTTRVSGIAFAMLTLAIGMLAWIAGGQWRSVTHGADGLNATFHGSLFGRDVGSFGDPVDAWPLVWAVLMGAVAMLWLISCTPWGRTLVAIRENEERARFSGYRTYLPRVLAFAISGLVASVAGTVNVVTTNFISLDSLYWSTSGLALIVAVIGGVKSVLGPPAGAIAFTVLQNYLSGSGSHYQSVLGVILILTVLVAPGGGADLVHRGRRWATRRLRHADQGGPHARAS